MTDLEICERIAEIEGISGNLFRNYCNAEYDDECRLISADHYNPLTDKALCFDLMVKHKVELTPLKNKQFFATAIKLYDVYGSPDPYLNRGYSDSDPQRAICLAIINSESR